MTDCRPGALRRGTRAARVGEWGNPENSERSTFLVWEGVDPTLLDRTVELLTDLFPVVGDVVRGNQCVSVLFAVSGDLR